MKKLLLLVVILLTVLVSSKYSYSALEIDKNITRQQYFGSGLGRLYGNRFGIYYFTKTYPKLTKIESRFFSIFKNTIVYIPLFGLLIYLGYKKHEI